MKAKSNRPVRRAAKKVEKLKDRFTAKQGQYLAYLHLYRKLHRCSPSEAEIAERPALRAPVPPHRRAVQYLAEKAARAGKERLQGLARCRQAFE